MSYKQPQVRVVPEYGRLAVQTFIGEQWVTVTIRERKNTANAIADALLAAMLKNNDDEFNAREQAERDAMAMTVDSVSPS